MSWGAPTVGSTTYQTPPYANGTSGYPASHHQAYGPPSGYSYPNGPVYAAPGPPQRPPENRPPKKKGNPIITKYPPPPGYRGPAQPQGSYGQNGYQHHYQTTPPSYPAGQTISNQYPAQGYGPQGYQPAAYAHAQPQPGYPQQPYPTTQPYQPPQTGYPPGQGYPPPSGFPSAQPYAAQQANYQPYQPQGVQQNLTQHTYPLSQGWHNPAAQVPPPSSLYDPSSATPQAPAPTPMSATGPATDAQGYSSMPEPQSAASSDDRNAKLDLAEYDWEFEFDGAIWPRTNEPVDPKLSLGIIHWYPPRQVTRALPSTFEEAEKQSLEAPAPKLENGESVSMYFTADNTYYRFLDVRQTDLWPIIKNDPAFVVFPPADQIEFIPIDECVARRYRPDEPLEEVQEEEVEEVEEVKDEETQESSYNVMDGLEQALSEDTANAKEASPVEEKETTLDQKQEDILAKLGVTGTPKPPSNDPIYVPFPQQGEDLPSSLPGKPPALPEKPPAPPASPGRPALGRDNHAQRANSYAASHRSAYAPFPQPRPYGSMSSASQTRPPSPPMKLSHGSQALTNGYISVKTERPNGFRDSPAGSDASNHTMTGSGFNVDQHSGGTERPATSTTPVQKLERSNSSISRKRSYDDVEATDDYLRQQDDHAKRKRRSVVADAYGRR